MSFAEFLYSKAAYDNDFFQRLTFAVAPDLVHSATVVSCPSVERGDGKEEELQEGDREVALQGEEGEEAFQEAYPLEGGENSFEKLG